MRCAVTVLALVLLLEHTVAGYKKPIIRFSSRTCPCHYVAPVCGSDGNVYPSDCDAKCMGVSVKNRCPGIDPVCGDNGERYRNACLAECEGAKVLKKKPPC